MAKGDSKIPKGDAPKPSSGNGGGRAGNFAAADYQIPKEGIREALGKKGRKVSIENAVKNANPFYNGGYADYSENCQRAVIAYELQRRGYDVMALPTFEGDKMPKYAGGNNHYWQGAFRHAKMENVGANTTAAATRNLEKKLLAMGDGARAIVKITAKRGNGGHVFNAEVQNGRVRYIDAQTNHEYDPKNVLAHSNPKTVGVMRTDNLRISARAKEMVTPNILNEKKKRR